MDTLVIDPGPTLFVKNLFGLQLFSCTGFLKPGRFFEAPRIHFTWPRRLS